MTEHTNASPRPLIGEVRLKLNKTTQNSTPHRDDADSAGPSVFGPLPFDVHHGDSVREEPFALTRVPAPRRQYVAQFG